MDRAAREDGGYGGVMAIRQLTSHGVMWYATNLYKIRKITLLDAVELSNVVLRGMLSIIKEHCVKGNVTMEQQIRALDYARNL